MPADVQPQHDQHDDRGQTVMVPLHETDRPGTRRDCTNATAGRIVVVGGSVAEIDSRSGKRERQSLIIANLWRFANGRPGFFLNAETCRRPSFPASNEV